MNFPPPVTPPAPSPAPSPTPAPAPGGGGQGSGGGTGFIYPPGKSPAVTAAAAKLPKERCNPDLNSDKKTDMTDLSILLFYYDRSGSALSCYDFNGNGSVDFPDVSIMMFYWTA